MLYILLQSSGGGLLGQLPFLAIMIAIIYFFFIRPQSKAQKEQNTFLTDLKKGQDVVTSSGIIGKITKIDDKEVGLQVNDKTTIRVTLGSISKSMTEAYNKVEEKK